MTLSHKLLIWLSMAAVTVIAAVLLERITRPWLAAIGASLLATALLVAPSVLGIGDPDPLWPIAAFFSFLVDLPIALVAAYSVAIFRRKREVGTGHATNNQEAEKH